MLNIKTFVPIVNNNLEIEKWRLLSGYVYNSHHQSGNRFIIVRNYFYSCKLVKLKEKMGDTCQTNVVSSYAVLSELISTIYNLTALSKASHDKQESELSIPDKIKKWLTILEHCETCLELATMSLPNFFKHGGSLKGNNRLKWTVVSLIQLTKCAGRMVLLLKYKEGLLPHPPVQVKSEDITGINIRNEGRQSYSYVLRSGRRVRSVREAYDQPNTLDITDSQLINKELVDIDMIIAEAAYIVKPIAHLMSLYFAGRKSWKPWMLSFAIDIASLIVLNRSLNKNELTKKQKDIILQRRASLIMYLLRSPFYDRNTKVMLQVLLYSLEIYIPCTSKILVKPLLAYLPLFQQIYFYVWSR